MKKFTFASVTLPKLFQRSFATGNPSAATISVIPEPTSQSDYTTAPVVSLDSKTTVGVEITTIGSAVSLGQTSMIDRQPVTTQWFCDEKEFITYLIATKSVRTAPMDISNTDDFISKGVDFTNEQSKIIIDIPQDGAIVRDVKLFSTNAAQIEVSFQRKSGIQTGLVRGAPTALHTDEFPAEKVNKIAITVIKTNDDYAAGGVTLSIVVCDETTAATKLQSHTTLVSIPKTVPPTTVTKCAEMELIGILISTNAIIVTPEDISNKEDLIRNSVTFTQHKPIFVIELPNAGMIIRDLRLDSINVHQINAIFIGQSGEQLVELKSNPNNLQKDQLPTEKVKQIILTLAETKGEKPPAGVTLSIIACDGGHATVKVKPGTQGTMTTRPSTTESTSSESTEETPLVRETTPASAETTVTRETKPQTTQRAFTRETIPATKETTVARETKPASEDPTSVHQTKAATTRTTTEREVKTTHADVKTTHGEVKTTEESTQGTTRKVVKTTGETARTLLTTGATTSQPAETTTRFHCKHMEYIDQLIASNSVTIAAENKAKKEDLIKLGVDFVELSPVIVIDIPKNGAIVRDVKVTSRNVAAIVVILTTVEGKTLSPIRGHPTSLPNHEFPAELVTKIVIQIVETTDKHSPKQVTLSVVACAPRVTVGTTEVHKPSQTTTHKPITLTEEKCTNMQDVVQLGSKVFASVNINGMPVKTASIPIWLAVTNLPFVIKATFKHPATLREVSIVNPSESEVFLMKVATDQTSDVFSMNRDAPTVTFENDLEFVGELTITLLSTRDNMLPENPVKLAILACYTDETFRTKAVVESTPATTNVSSSLLSTYPSTNPSKHKTIPDVLTTTSDTCEDGIALIPYQSNNENKPLMPRYFIQPRTPYQPSNINPGEIGVSFPASDKPYIIIFPMAPIAIIKSVRLPNTTNVDQIRVMFLDAKDKPIMTHPLDQVPLQITSQVTTSPKINVYLSTKVNSVHITLLHTSDNQPPHDVTVEIVVCVAPTITTPTTSVTEVETHTVPTTDHVSSQPLPDSPCKPKTKYSARITVGACISQQEIQHESCVGYCPSYEQLDPLTGNVAAKECSCCAPDSTYTESIMMDCRNTTTGRNEQRTTQIIRIRSCKCLICLGTAKRSYSDDKGTHETMAKTNPTAIKTRTRRR
ncbi:unnamed protein product [Rotaria socialis]|uniref:CTCK domain-containing protein n=1 Tax=Rotaria socialis TaxID=392032 RepID=A0A818FMK6_9BILA|nr:unnamed protein product [Rotaria socialis]